MADACCDPLMDLSRTHARQRRVLATVLTINIATFGLMVLAAWKGRSTSLLSGALDNFGDALTYALSLAVVGATLAAQSRVAVVKGLLIMGAALAVAIQIGYRLANPTVPVFETMGIAGLLNLGANAVCLALLTPYRRGDVNMASAWECSRNDIIEGFAVLAAAGAVGVFGAGWPDLLIAAGLLALFIRSSIRVLREAVKGLRPADHGEGPGRVQDPVCKCWVDPNRTLSALHGGQTYHFCAPSCLGAFRAEPGAYIPRPGALPVMKG